MVPLEKDSKKKFIYPVDSGAKKNENSIKKSRSRSFRLYINLAWSYVGVGHARCTYNHVIAHRRLVFVNGIKWTGEQLSLAQVVLNLTLPRLVSSRRLTMFSVCGGELEVFSFEYSPTRSILGVWADDCSLAARWLELGLVDSAGILVIDCGG